LISILIVLLLVTIAIWGPTFMEDWEKVSQDVIDDKRLYQTLKCDTNLFVSLKFACQENDSVRLLVENPFFTDLEGLEIRFGGPMKYDSKQVMGRIKPGDIKAVNLAFDLERIGKLEEIKVFPYIKVQDKVFLCSNRFDYRSDLEKCSIQ